MTVDIPGSIPIDVAVTALKTTTLVLGGLITYHAYRAYRRTRSPVLRTFTGGFALVTLGLLFGGGIHQLLGLDLVVGLLAQRLLTVAGFGLLVYSLYAQVEESTTAGQ